MMVVEEGGRRISWRRSQEIISVHTPCGNMAEVMVQAQLPQDSTEAGGDTGEGCEASLGLTGG
jgi:hypothetical protein